MTKEGLMIGGGILLGGAALAGLCALFGEEAAKQYDATKDLNENLEKAEAEWKKTKRTNAKVDFETAERVNNAAARSSFAQVDIMSKLLKTEQWVRYGYYYMTDNSAELFELDTETCELLNGISVLAGFGKMYPKFAVADLKDYDLKVCDMTKTFLVDLDEVSKYVADGNFQIKMKLKMDYLKNGAVIEDKAKVLDENGQPIKDVGTATVTPEQQSQAEESGSNWRLGSDGLFHLGRQVFKEDENLYRPFATEANNGVPQTTVNTVTAPFKQPEGMSAREFDKLNSVLTPAIVGTDNYWYTYDVNGATILNVANRAGMMNTCTIVDTGEITGGSHVQVMGNFSNGVYIQGILIDAELFPELASRVIQNPMYLLDSVEVGTVSAARKIDSTLVKYFDFTGTPWMDDMSDPNAKRLEKRLRDILTMVRQNTDPNLDMPRFRFDHYENPDAFTVVSDSHVSQKLPFVMSYHHDDNHALTFEQRGNTLLQTYMGMTQAYDTSLIQMTYNSGVA